MSEQDTPRIFLCHANEDKLKVEKLYHKLKEAGYHPWLDKYDLIPGQNWRREIERLIGNPYNLVVICISDHSANKRGVVQQEIKWALDILDKTPEGTIYLIPARLEPCQTPDRLSHLHWVDLFEVNGFDNLKRALDFELGRRANEMPYVPLIGLGQSNSQLDEVPQSLESQAKKVENLPSSLDNESDTIEHRPTGKTEQRSSTHETEYLSRPNLNVKKRPKCPSCGATMKYGRYDNWEGDSDGYQPRYEWRSYCPNGCDGIDEWILNDY